MAKQKPASKPKSYVTDSNIPVKPFYQKSSKKTKKEEPGKYPFTRGIHTGMYRDRFWTMRQIFWVWRCSPHKQALQVYARKRSDRS